MLENLTWKPDFSCKASLFSDIIAFIEKHKTIHTRFGMNDLFLRPSFGQCYKVQIPKKKNKETRKWRKIASMFAFLIPFVAFAGHAHAETIKVVFDTAYAPFGGKSDQT